MWVQSPVVGCARSEGTGVAGGKARVVVRTCLWVSERRGVSGIRGRVLGKEERGNRRETAVLATFA